MSEIGVRRILRSSSLISAVNILGGGIAFFANFAIARLVGPEVLGAVGLVNLWLLYAGLLRPGLVSAGFRDMLHLMGSGRADEARRVQNVALTYEGALVSVSAAVLMLAALAYHTPLLKAGMILAGVTFAVQSVVRYQEMVQWAQQRFGLIAQANLANRLLGPTLGMTGAYLWGGYGLLVEPILTAIATVYFYWVAAPPSGYRIMWDHSLAKRLLRSGVPLTLITVLYWGFRTSDRSMVAVWFPLGALGYFVFAMRFIDMGLQLCSDFYNVLQVKLLSELGRTGSVRTMAPQLTRLAVLTVAVTCAGANLAQAGFGPVIWRFLPRFSPSIVPFDTLAFNLACLSAPMLPGTLLTSTLLNRQASCCLIQLAGLAINIAVAAMLTSRGCGLAGIALSSVVSQIVVSVWNYRLLHESLFSGAGLAEKLRFYAWMAALPIACWLTYHLLLGLPQNPVAYGWAGLLIHRVSGVLVVWALILTQVYRCWWSQSTAIADLWSSISDIMFKL